MKKAPAGKPLYLPRASTLKQNMQSRKVTRHFPTLTPLKQTMWTSLERCPPCAQRRETNIRSRMPYHYFKINRSAYRDYKMRLAWQCRPVGSRDPREKVNIALLSSFTWVITRSYSCYPVILLHYYLLFLLSLALAKQTNKNHNLSLS